MMVKQLTTKQLQILRSATKDETAFEQVLDVFNDVIASPVHRLFGLDDEQIRNIQTVIDVMPIALYVKDTESRFLMANRHAIDQLYITEYDELIGKTDFDFLPAEIAQKHFEMEQQIFQTQEPVFEFETSMPDNKGNTAHYLISKSPIMDAKGIPIGLIGINQNITRRKIIQRKLNDERNLLRTIIDHIEDKIYIKDREGRFIMANESTLRQQGHGEYKQLSDIIGKTDFDFMSAERAQQMFDEEKRIMESREAIVNQELFTPDSVTKQGDMWFLVSKVPLIDEKGIVNGIVGVNRNITSRMIAQKKEIEVEVERKKSQFLKDFIRDSSHEFRTPLSVIRSATYLLSKVTDTSKHPNYINQIVAQTEQMERLISDLNLIISIDHSDVLETNIFKLSDTLRYLEDYVNHLPNKADRTIVFHDEIAVSQYNGNETLIEDALQRLLDNAVRYSHSDSTITVTATSDDDMITITIEDDGVGMSGETMDAMYQRFFRADTAHTTKGFGLGLPISKRIIELHGGTLIAKSQLGVGSVFTIKLPYNTT